MKRKDKQKIIMAFIVLLLVAIISDLSREKIIKNGTIERDPIGGEEREVSLIVGAEGQQEEEYQLKVLPMQPTEDEAKEYFDRAITTIEKDFREVKEIVPIHTSYEEDIVKAEWSLAPYNLVDAEGKILYEKVEKEGNLVNAQVKLSCGKYEEIYQFSFEIMPKELSKEESFWIQLEEWMNEQLSKEGDASLVLPTEINGQKVSWREEREYITYKILLLELVAVLLLWVTMKRKKMEEEKKRILQMERDYPDVVNQLSLLLGAGMTTRQAWLKLSEQYSFKRKAKMIEEREVYEAINRMSRRFAEGESERALYHQFSQEIPALCFHKLMRLLLGNLEKGTQGISIRLEEESRVAYEQRILQAKKLGEEASTKMVFPLMLMLILVMGIVILPALMEFQI